MQTRSSLSITNILVAHTDESSRYLIKQILRRAGYHRVAVSASARQVIDRLQHGRFNLLVTGSDLGDLDSWRLARLVHSGRFCSSTLPMVVMCDDEHLPLAELLAQEHGVCALALSNLAHLPEISIQLITDHANATPSVLIIEDDDRAAQFAALALQSYYRVDIAGDGKTGLACWQNGRHDLVLLDIMLPGLSGPAVLQCIKADNPTQLVVVITAYADQERHRNLVLAGATEFIEKPIHANGLRRVCTSVLRAESFLRLQQKDRDNQTIIKRLWAADYCLENGQVGLAAHHVKHALATTSSSQLPTDDQWADLISDDSDDSDND